MMELLVVIFATASAMGTFLYFVEGGRLFPVDRQCFVDSRAGLSEKHLVRQIRRRLLIFALIAVTGVTLAAIIPILPTEIVPTYTIFVLLVTIIAVSVNVVGLLRLFVKRSSQRRSGW